MKKLFETLKIKVHRSKVKLVNNLKQLRGRIKKRAVDTLLLTRSTYLEWKKTKSFKTFCRVALWFAKVVVQVIINKLINWIFQCLA